MVRSSSKQRLATIDMVSGVPLGAHPQALSSVLQYLGAGQFIWVGSVCKGLQKAYLQLHNRQKTSYYSSTFSSLARLQWSLTSGAIDLESNAWPSISQVATAACERGDVAMLEFLRQRVGDAQIALLEPTCLSAPAAFYGHLHLLQHLHDKGYLAVDWAMTFAAEGSQTACLQWLVDEGHAWSHLISYYAVQGGSTAMLQWLLDHGCPLRHPQAMCRAAVKFLRLEALQWLHEHGLGDWQISQVRVRLRKLRWHEQRFTPAGAAMEAWLQALHAEALAALVIPADAPEAAL